MKKLTTILLFMSLGLPAISQDLATVFIYRPKGRGSDTPFDLYRDSTLVGTINPGAIINDRLASGTYVFKGKLDNTQTLTLAVQGGYTYFVECGVSAAEQKTPTIVHASKSRAKDGLKTINANAVSLIRPDMKVVPPAGAVDEVEKVEGVKASPKLEVGLKVGANQASYSAALPNSKASSRTAIHVGLYVKAPLGKIFYLRPELYYSQQGQVNTGTIATGSTTTSNDYLNIPILFETAGLISVQFGPQVGLLLTSKEIGTVNGSNVNNDLAKVSNSLDYAGVLGLSVNPGKTLRAGFRYQYSFNTLYKSPYPDVQNRVLHFYLGIAF